MISHIDFSIFIGQSEAFGYVSGELELPETPQIGDSISFPFPKSGFKAVSSADFGGLLIVTDRIISVGVDAPRPIALSLSDIIATNRASAMEIATYFEKEFGLFAEIYEPRNSGSE